MNVKLVIKISHCKKIYELQYGITLQRVRKPQLSFSLVCQTNKKKRFYQSEHIDFQCQNCATSCLFFRHLQASKEKRRKSDESETMLGSSPNYLSLSLSLSHTHTHTLSLPHSHAFSLSHFLFNYLSLLHTFTLSLFISSLSLSHFVFFAFCFMLYQYLSFLPTSKNSLRIHYCFSSVFHSNTNTLPASRFPSHSLLGQFLFCR